MSVFSKISGLIKHRESVSSYLEFKGDSDNPYWGSVTDDEIEFLKELVKEANRYEGPIIEIGALFGMTSQLIAAHKKLEKQFYIIENYSWNPLGLSEKDHKMFLRRNLYGVLKNQNTNLVERDNHKFYAAYQAESPAMIFIDADHTYEGVKKDIDWAIEQGISIISGHDYSEKHPGVVKAVRESFGDGFQINSSIWVYRNG